jgi:hypothetical protein
MIACHPRVFLINLDGRRLRPSRAANRVTVRTLRLAGDRLDSTMPIGPSPIEGFGHE